MLHRDDDEEAGERRRTAALLSLILVLLLAIGGIVLLREIDKRGRIEDCLMSGRTNCAPIAGAPQTR